MAKRSAEKMKEADDAIIRGTNNVFAHLGFAGCRGAADQAAAGGKLAVTEPKVSALADYKLDGFSVER